MTEKQKKMKKYTNAIERRLNLPRDVKARVMSDFVSSIEARRESGLTDEEIYAELGTPKKAAAELNEQMKEYAYRKSPWRFVFLAMAVIGGLWLGYDIIVAIGAYIWLRLCGFMYPNEFAAVGIIGGADGPTSIFLTVPDWTVPVLMLVLLIVGILGFLRLRKCKQK